MSKDKLVSIITPSYNSSAFVAVTINSVIKQTYTNWEMLIVDDCSTDNSVEIIRNYISIDARIILIANDKNVGPAEARNIALRRAKGDYIAFLDSDELEFMQQKEIAFSYTAYERITEDGKYVNIIKVPKRISYYRFLRNTIIGTLTVMIDKTKTGYFEMPDLRSSHDMALWCNFMKQGFKAYGINEVLASYRIVSNSNTAKKWKAAKDVWNVYRSTEHLNLFFASINFIGYVFNAIKKRMF